MVKTLKELAHPTFKTIDKGKPLSPKQLLDLHKKGKIKYVHTKIRVPFQKKLATYTELNLSRDNQAVYHRLYQKGCISGDILGKGKITGKCKL